MQPVTIVGNIGNEPVLSKSNGKSSLRLSVATYAGKDQGGQKQATWVTVFLHGELAEAVATQVKRGQRVSCGGFATVQKSEGFEPNLVLSAFECVRVVATTTVKPFNAGENTDEAEIPF